MPRVNRDLQRRMAARRERERRRPATERRYQFGSPEAAIGSDAEPNVHDGDNGTRRPSPASAVATHVAASPRVSKSFSEYRDEYGYVVGDLRRVAAVIGSLLLILLVLYFALPH